jgi:hypothetical protein
MTVRDAPPPATLPVPTDLLFAVARYFGDDTVPAIGTEAAP